VGYADAQGGGDARRIQMLSPILPAADAPDVPGRPGA